MTSRLGGFIWTGNDESRHEVARSLMGGLASSVPNLIESVVGIRNR